MKKVWRKLSLVLAMIIGIACILPASTFAEGSLGTIGTNSALGSPLLDTDFQVQDWDKWEFVTFGVFLSNFVQPFIDDYESAFSTNSTRGTKGSGFKALQFGSGSDSSNTKVLEGLLKAAISAQIGERSRKPVYVNYKGRFINKETGTEERREAKVKDLFMFTTTVGMDDANKDYNSILGGSETGGWWSAIKGRFLDIIHGGGLVLDLSKIDGGLINVDPVIKWDRGVITAGYTQMLGVQYALIPEFFIDNGGTDTTTVLDYNNGWDIQMMTAWLGKTFGGQYKDYINEQTFKDFLECRLYIDAFGNIVTDKDGHNYMVFPSAANQHITTTPSYNLLNSVLFGGQYFDGQENQLLEQAGIGEKHSIGNSMGLSAISSGDLPKGKNIILFDSDSILYAQTIKDLEKANAVEGADQAYRVTKNISTVKMGQVMQSLLNCDINNTLGAATGFRIETIKADEISPLVRVKSMGRACNILSITNPIDPTVKMLDYVNEKGIKIKLFGTPTILSVKQSNDALARYPNYIYQNMNNNVSQASASADALTPDKWKELMDKMATAVTDEQLTTMALTGGSSRESGLNVMFRNFLTNQIGITVKKGKNADGLSGSNLAQLKSRGYTLQDGSDIAKQNKTRGQDYQTEGGINNSFNRLIKAYTASPVMEQVSNILAVREGTDFALWSPYIYATYLEWYGIIGEGEPNFSKSIYDDKSVVFDLDINNITAGTAISDEEKKKNILDYAYMLLDPTAGKEYRSNMMMDNFSNWVRKTYEKIVYGGALDFYYNTNANRYGGGFLKIDNYSENFMTGWFIQKYAEYIVIIIAVLGILILLVGILTRKKIIWYFLTLLLMINIVVLTPSLGEVTPFLVNGIVEGMFNDKMSYWAVSEGVSNAIIEKQVSKDNNQMQTMVADNAVDANEAQTVLGVIKALNVAYLDRSLMLKLDISKKITDTQLYSYDEIQNLQSARWLLPIMLRQFTASDGSANYVYVPMGDEFDNLSNLYWKYKPSDKATTETINAGITTGNTTGAAIQDKYMMLPSRQALYQGYTDTSYIKNELRGSIKLGDSYKNEIGTTNWKSDSRNGTNDADSKHTFFYLLPNVSGIPKNTYTSWEDYVTNTLDNSSTVRDGLATTEDLMERYAGRYDVRDPGSVQDEFGFLWNTENPMNYLYQVVKDTFEPDAKVSVLAGKLQGELTKNRSTMEEVRESFMHYSDTEKIKDFLDMEELFTNVIPYMYSTQVLAGGTDGKSGVFGTEKMESYEVYKNNYKSWLFRSNWVTKLMESRELTAPATIKSLDGTMITVKNPMLPSSYIEASNGMRPMIFSEAEMYALGLSKADLTEPELKILNVNKAVERKWTLLLNYVNVPGMTKEVLFRQMALDATIEFDKEFTTNSVLNASLAMYPAGIDLRNISFDSVMKMLMLNTTKDVRFIYGDTMTRVIENNDIFSAVLMLIDAFLCSYVIPFVRNVLLGLLFYLGLWSIVGSIIAGAKAKLKITTAFVINNVVFALMTVVYYLIFSVMISVTYKDDVLTLSNITVSVGNPIWVFIIIVLASLAYLFGCYKLITFSIKNYRDMGFEVYAAFAGMMAGRISDSMQNLGANIASSISGEQTESNTGTGKSASSTTEKYSVRRKGNKDTVIEDDETDETVNNTLFDSGYTSDRVSDNTTESTSTEIDAEIERGKKM